MKVIKKPYSLEQTQKMLSLGWSVKTESGKSTECVTIADSKYPEFPIKCIVTNPDGSEFVDNFSRDGKSRSYSDNLVFMKLQDKVDKSELRPFQYVLVKTRSNLPWTLDIYTGSYTEMNQFSPLITDKDTNVYACIGGIYGYCIPYKGNENLFRK